MSDPEIKEKLLDAEGAANLHKHDAAYADPHRTQAHH